MLSLWLLFACSSPPVAAPDCVPAVEVCNGVDDDCDGRIDDDDESLVAPRFFDADGDGYGGMGVHSCDESTTVELGGDCDDDDPSTHPGAQEVCGGGDDDCDGWVDGADRSLTALVAPDVDGDGHGDALLARVGCPGPGLVAPADDCDDRRATGHPGAEEVCDGIADNDCDGVSDPADVDADGDGEGACSDCDDADPARSHGFEERCDGIDTDCDGLVDLDDDSVNPFTCGPHCPDDDLETIRDVATYEVNTYNPCDLDPEVDQLCTPGLTQPLTDRHHRTRVRTDLEHHRDQLFLFLPPGPGNSNFRVRQWAAAMGYRVLSLGFVNDTDIADVCNPVGDPCHHDFRYETWYGADLSPHLEVDRPDSMEQRLVRVLQHLREVDGDRGWGRYLDEDDHVVWSDVVLAGWSIGAGQAAFVAKVQAAHGVVLLSGPKDRVNDPERIPSSWLRTPGETEGCRHYGVFHGDEPLVAHPDDILRQAWSSLGMPFPAVPLEQAERGDQTLIMSVPTSAECSGHKLTGHDACLPDEAYDAYTDLLCAVGDALACDAP
jgi:hypothetical protein